MEKIQVKFKRLHPGAHIPVYGTPFSAGADIYACLDEPVTVNPGETVFFHGGFSVELPEGYVGLICARSSVASKRGLAPANKVGVIDSDYRGEIITALHNHSAKPQTVEHGERIAQLIVMPYLPVEYIETDDLSQTERGEGGYGSTGR